MIRYRITPQELEALIRKESSTWLNRARKLTRQHRKQKRFAGKGIWSEIKRVYMELQQFKCAYCERPMGANEDANIDYDVEHFRPKNRVTPWPDAKTRAKRGITYKVRNGSAKGYYLLAHSPLNYAVTCKICNSPLKADHFPIAGIPSSTNADLAKLNQKEKPLLLFPVGAGEEDPEQILGFEGYLPTPARKSGPGNLRARVCIDFFRLDTRGELLTGRATVLMLVWDQLEKRRAGTRTEKAKAQEFLDFVLKQDRLAFCGCARAFIRLYEQDRERARLHHEAASQLVQGKEPALHRTLLGG